MSRGRAVAVVIVSWNSRVFLERTLSALARQTLRSQRVIVVDNASTDGSADAVEKRHPDVELVRLDENTGFAAANNLAVRLAEDCELVALLNPDAFPEPEWLDKLVGAAEDHPEYAFFGSRLVAVDPPGRLDGTGDVYHVSGLAWRRDHGRPIGVNPPEGEIFSPCAAAALYRRDVFLGIGGFDESFFCYFEDSDLSFRLRLAGHRCLYVPGAVVYHMGSVTAGRQSAFTLYYSHRNLVWTYVKNMPSPLLWLYLPQHLLVNTVSLLSFSLRGQGRALLASKRDAVRGLPRVLAERRAIQGRRRVGAGELRHEMSKGPNAYVVAVMRAWTLMRGQT